MLISPISSFFLLAEHLLKLGVLTAELVKLGKEVVPLSVGLLLRHAVELRAALLGVLLHLPAALPRLHEQLVSLRAALFLKLCAGFLLLTPAFAHILHILLAGPLRGIQHPVDQKRSLGHRSSLFNPQHPVVQLRQRLVQLRMQRLVLPGFVNQQLQQLSPAHALQILILHGASQRPCCTIARLRAGA